MRCGPAGMGRPKTIVQAFVVPALAKNARAGHPTLQNGRELGDERVGHPPVLEPATGRVAANYSQSVFEG